VRVFLDTNVLVSAFAARGLCADLFRAVLAHHQLVAGERTLEELRRTLSRKLKVPETIVEELEAFIRHEAEVTTGVAPIDLDLRDPDDVFIVGEAVAVGADLLVTGDRDLLDVEEATPLPILSPRGLWDRLKTAE